MKLSPYILLVGALCLGPLCPPVASQTMDLTVLAGISSATHGGDGADGVALGRRNGIALGAGLSMPLSPLFGATLQALYTQKGARYTDEDWNERSAYLELPLLLTVSVPVGEASPVAPFLMAGPALGIKLGAHAVVEGERWDESEWGGPPVSGTDLGLVLGAGIGVPAARGELQIIGRYVSGLGEVYEAPWPGFGTIKNRAFELLVGYSFPLRAPRP